MDFRTVTVKVGGMPWFIGILAALLMLATMPITVSATHLGGAADFTTTFPLVQTDPGTPVQSLSFIDLDGDSFPDDLNGSGSIEAGLFPSGDQLVRIDRTGQVFQGTIDDVTAVTKKGNKVDKKLTGADVMVTFNSTIFIGPGLGGDVHAIFGVAGGQMLVTSKGGRESLTVSFTAALQGTLDVITGQVLVLDTGQFTIIDARGGLNSVKKINGDFTALAQGIVGAESVMATITGLVK